MTRMLLISAAMVLVGVHAAEAQSRVRPTRQIAACQDLYEPQYPLQGQRYCVFTFCPTTGSRSKKYCGTWGQNTSVSNNNSRSTR